MKGFVADIEELTEQEQRLPASALYRQESSIGADGHNDHDQFFRVEEGDGEVVIDGRRSKIKEDDAIIVPAGARHNIVNTGEEPLRLYTLYAPPEHRIGTAHATRADANASKEHFDGKATE